jgi:DNA polymerase-3 subunit gamma/tau
MAQLALYRKYRSNDFNELYGQDYITTTLKNSVKNGTFSHAYLFCGPRGTGKTSAARLLAKAINCEHNVDGNPDNKCQYCKLINENKTMDIIEIDAASHTQVDNIREVIVERAHFAPTNLKYKVYIIDEAHMLSKSSFNALLKTLEEPPAHSIFILATTEPNKIIPTIISRCQRFDFKRIGLEDILGRLSFIAKEEKINIDKDGLEIIARSSEGGFRDAISLLDQINSTTKDKITGEKVREITGMGDFALVQDLAIALIKKEKQQAFEAINRVAEAGYDINQIILISSFQLFY